MMCVVRPQARLSDEAATSVRLERAPLSLGRRHTEGRLGVVQGAPPTPHYLRILTLTLAALVAWTESPL